MCIGCIRVVRECSIEVNIILNALAAVGDCPCECVCVFSGVGWVGRGSGGGAML